MEEIVHEPVLKGPVLKWLGIGDDKFIVDCTLGEGGHSKAILETNSTVKVIGIEQDVAIKKIADERLSVFGDRFVSVEGNFSGIKQLVSKIAPAGVDAILMDLGISSFHYEKSGRGFSFMNDEPLDMRLSDNCLFSAEDMINDYSLRDLVRVFREYGEERFSGRIAKAIIREREVKRIESSKVLASIISSSVPGEYRRGRIHPATRCFQGIRIEVNRELAVLTEVLPAAVDILKLGGRLCVISFHSLEDRIVKKFIRNNIPQCRCPDGLPICVCGREGSLQMVTRKPIVADENEVKMNPRSRSAKLRVAEKINN